MLKTNIKNLKSIYMNSAMMIAVVTGFQSVTTWETFLPTVLISLGGLAIFRILEMFMPIMSDLPPLSAAISGPQYLLHVLVATMLVALVVCIIPEQGSQFSVKSLDTTSVVLTVLRNTMLAPLIAYWMWNAHPKLRDINNIEFDPIRSP